VIWDEIDAVVGGLKKNAEVQRETVGETEEQRERET
jgi:hypothetical protein